MKVLHIANLDKFIPPFIGFLRENNLAEGHFFFTYGDLNKYQYTVLSDSYHANSDESTSLLAKIRYRYLKLLIFMYKADSILIHGLNDFNLILMLFLNPCLHKKINWVIWGGDLYEKDFLEKNTKSKEYILKQFIKSSVIKRIGYLISYLDGDVRYAREKYGARGKYKKCIMYLSNVFDSEYIRPNRNSENNELNILVGNSADPENHHYEIFNKIGSKENVVIIAPLSYGIKGYAQEVIVAGKNSFGNNFKPITQLMPIEDYNDLLNSVDIAVFNHKRQQAMGTTITLLGLGKTVYLRRDTPQWETLTSLGIALLDIDDFSFTVLSKYESEENMRIVKKEFSTESLIHQFSNLFS
ncbi:TDP-N-acetylfucosamine:lipid II N-acetylfucosaminyltransferase family protein [Vibrio vulnificus]|uniref:TDP-N-acetylfucosamine:lipid II N-acetylfucosaminyltransferase n=1 Tax=Vibrio vulnificus TaxID=672 RepID=UPI001CDD81CA|nr:TDP-N-acetylfucosamine:lipid II N-acetylfucosaminyltransferase [Vibrio vulnificus]MCA3894943.1 TDP-N-acetylfucosamine:lipid II N-acetylfucosaminyltransferase [Vibrio vulnificus]